MFLVMNAHILIFSIFIMHALVQLPLTTSCHQAGVAGWFCQLRQGSMDGMDGSNGYSRAWMIFIIYLSLLTFYFTLSSYSRSKPVQIILDKNHDKHNWWYLEYRAKLHNSQKSFIPTSHDECENLLLNGHWHKPSFTISGIIFEDELGRG